jgi:two-component system, NarL family, response regulator NreC
MTARKTRILICDDHALFREGVKSILAAHPSFEVVGQAGDGQEGVEMAKRLHPDVVLLDISMPGLKGFDAARRIRKAEPSVKVLMLTIYDDEDMVARCLSAGVSGYVLKDAPPAQLIYAIEEVSKGQQYMSPRVVNYVMDKYVSGMQQPSTRYDLLSDREREILVLLAEGETLKEVAHRLRLSVKTVDAHKVNLMRKIEVHDRSELIRYALRNKLIEA